MTALMTALSPLAEDIRCAMADGLAPDELFTRCAPALRRLVEADDWLPAEYAQPRPDRYAQYLIHRDPLVDFSVVSFVWGPGQSTPIHDHLTWGLIGILEGVEISQRYEIKPTGMHPVGGPERLERGHVDFVSPQTGDIHQVSNGLSDAVSISIHVYGGDIGTIRRHAYLDDGTASTFISQYTSPS